MSSFHNIFVEFLEMGDEMPASYTKGEHSMTGNRDERCDRAIS
ncbi:hypothetical protein [Nostoc sp. MG11]|nr:hypothetical protein [Nostoc sp. MG11]